MKIFLLTFAFLISTQLNAQWSGAILDTLTNNNVKDEVNRQSIAIDSADNLHIVYSREISPSGWNIFYKKRNANATWTNEEIVSPQTGYNPVIAASNINGEAYVAFEAIDTSDKEIYICSNAGGTWNCFQLTSDNLDDTSPSIAVDSSGFLHLTWIKEKSNGSYKIMYATNLSGNWALQELIASQLGQFGSGASPEIAVDKSGFANIAYRGNNGNGYRIHYAHNQIPGGSTWNYEIISTPNDQDLAFAILVDGDTVSHLLITGNDGFGLPLRAYYHTKKFSDPSFSPSVEVAPTFRGQAGDLFVDRNKIPHFVLNEVNGNIFTGNVIYADSTDWNGRMLLNSGDIYNANLVMDSEDRAFLLAYQGNTSNEEEVVVFGSSNPVIIPTLENKESPYTIISSDNLLKIHFRENYFGRLLCTSIDGKIVFDNRGNFYIGEIFSINIPAKGVYLLISENAFGRFVKKFSLK